ncbi:uncharacterized protein LOC142976818 [Anticarsia gemmatalis]|uniref:uncharacterized protein LOC142976818 n=1 Tax=Anticarsia gemmatalis TaxID=129554 RepID=UPI003F774638
MYNEFYRTKIPVNGPIWTPVGALKRPTKVTPVTVRPAKQNVIKKSACALRCVTSQIYAVLLLGINRYYLLQKNRPLLILSYVYSLTVISLVVFNMYRSETISAAHFVFKYTLLIEYFFIFLMSFLSSKKKLITFFRDLNKFDETLNLSKDLKVIDAGYVCFFWVSGCLIYSVVEYTLLYFFLYLFLDDTTYSFYVMMLTHDYEQILFFVLLRNIYLRLRVLKAHVSKMFSAEGRTGNYRGKLSKVEALSNNARLDITSLHRVYDLLHKCADQLNSAMSLPMTIILLTAGLSTTMLLKMMVKVIQTVTTSNSFGRSTILYLFSRSMKYTVMVVMSCYYSSVTSTQVTAIRTLLHDAVHSFPLDKIERRKVKAFFQLTRENEFVYALGGVVRLNMSLPLSYMSLCTTYLVISIQFSKFFD